MTPLQFVGSYAVKKSPVVTPLHFRRPLHRYGFVGRYFVPVLLRIRRPLFLMTYLSDVSASRSLRTMVHAVAYSSAVYPLHVRRSFFYTVSSKSAVSMNRSANTATDSEAPGNDHEPRAPPSPSAVCKKVPARSGKV